MDCKHGLRSGCYYCHARNARPDVNGTVRQSREASRVVTARGALTHAAWQGSAKAHAGRMGLRAYIGWYGQSRPVSTQRTRWEPPR